MSLSSAQLKNHVRQQLRARRNTLSPGAQKQAAKSLCQQLLQIKKIRQARHIALYWPNDGEISPMLFAKLLQAKKKNCYLPVILPNLHLSFKPFPSSKGLRKNRFGIAEPTGKRSHCGADLDIVLLPLVAFDQQGHRLGMGGGFYDRTFAFRLKENWRNKPLLIGLAHNFQEVAELPHDSWDIPLSAIVTEKRVITINVKNVCRPG